MVGPPPQTVPSISQALARPPLVLPEMHFTAGAEGTLHVSLDISAKADQPASAVIHWGDSQLSRASLTWSGTIAPPEGDSYCRAGVFGEHTYASPGTYDYNVTLPAMGTTPSATLWGEVVVTSPVAVARPAPVSLPAPLPILDPLIPIPVPTNPPAPPPPVTAPNGGVTTLYDPNS